MRLPISQALALSRAAPHPQVTMTVCPQEGVQVQRCTVEEGRQQLGHSNNDNNKQQQHPLKETGQTGQHHPTQALAEEVPAIITAQVQIEVEVEAEA